MFIRTIIRITTRQVALPGAVLFFLCAMSVTEASANPQVDDLKAIEACLNHYIEGARTHNSAETRQAFHETGGGMGYLADGSLVFATAAEYYDILDSTPPPSNDYTGEIQSISLTGKSAMGIVIEENDNGVDYVDYMSLAKIDGEWKIVFKTWGITKIHEVAGEH